MDRWVGGWLDEWWIDGQIYIYLSTYLSIIYLLSIYLSQLQLQYELIGITDKEYIDEEESTKPVATPNPIMNGQSHDQSHDTEQLGNKEGKSNDDDNNLFDDPTYILSE